MFNVTSFDSQNGEDLIVKGDGSATVVFDIGFATQFHGNILLQDLSGKFYGSAGYAGLTPDQVIFNMYDGANLYGGDTLDITATAPRHPPTSCAACYRRTARFRSEHAPHRPHLRRRHTGHAGRVGRHDH